MIIGNKGILKRLESGDITILPFSDTQLNGASYDLRLSEFFIKLDITSEGFVDPSKPICESKFKKFTIGTPGFILQPKERVLASTVEKIGSNVTTITTTMHAKSSFARWGLEVCSCAGYGDPGYADNWTLEIFNKNNFGIRLVPEMIICQIVFHEVAHCDRLYVSKYNDKELDVFDRMIPKSIKKLQIPKDYHHDTI